MYTEEDSSIGSSSFGSHYETLHQRKPDASVESNNGMKGSTNSGHPRSHPYGTPTARLSKGTAAVPNPSSTRSWGRQQRQQYHHRSGSNDTIQMGNTATQAGHQLRKEQQTERRHQHKQKKSQLPPAASSDLSDSVAMDIVLLENIGEPQAPESSSFAPVHSGGHRRVQSFDEPHMNEVGTEVVAVGSLQNSPMRQATNLGGQQPFLSTTSVANAVATPRRGPSHRGRRPVYRDSLDAPIHPGGAHSIGGEEESSVMSEIGNRMDATSVSSAPVGDGSHKRSLPKTPQRHRYGLSVSKNLEKSGSNGSVEDSYRDDVSEDFSLVDIAAAAAKERAPPSPEERKLRAELEVLRDRLLDLCRTRLGGEVESREEGNEADAAQRARDCARRVAGILSPIAAENSDLSAAPSPSGVALYPSPEVGALLSRSILLAAGLLSRFCLNENRQPPNSVSTPAVIVLLRETVLGLLKSCFKGVPVDLSFAILRYPLPSERDKDGGSSDDDKGNSEQCPVIPTVLTILSDIVNQEHNGDVNSKIAREDAFVVLARAMDVVESVLRLTTSSYPRATGYSSSSCTVDSSCSSPSVLGSSVSNLGLSQASLHGLVRCALVSLRASKDTGQEAEGGSGGSISGTVKDATLACSNRLLSALIRQNLVDSDDVSFVMQTLLPADDSDKNDGEESGKTLRAIVDCLVHRARRYIESPSAPISACVMDGDLSSLSLIAQLFRGGVAGDNASFDAAALYGAAPMERLLSMGFAPASSSSGENWSSAGAEALLVVLDDVCRCDAHTGGLTALKSSRSISSVLKKGWKYVLAAGGNTGATATYGKSAEEEVQAQVRVSVACLSVIHAHCPSLVRQSLSDAMPRQQQNHLGSEFSAGAREAARLISLDKLTCTLLCLSRHESLFIASSAVTLLRCLLQSPPSSSSRALTAGNQDELSRGMWKCLVEGGSGKRGSSERFHCAKELSHLIHHIILMIREMADRASKQQGTPPTRENHALVAEHEFDTIFDSMWNEPRLCVYADLINIVVQSDGCMDRLLRQDAKIEFALLNALGRIATHQIATRDLVHEEVGKATSSSIGKSFISGADSNGLGCAISLSSALILAKAGYTNLSSSFMRNPVAPSNIEDIINSEDITPRKQNSQEIKRKESQMSARKILRKCLFRQRAVSSTSATSWIPVPPGKHCMSLKDALVHAMTQGFSRELIHRAMQLILELQCSNSSENIAFCTDSIFSWSVVAHEKEAAILKEIKSRKEQGKRLESRLSELCEERDFLQHSMQRKAISWEMELNHSKTMAEAEAAELLDSCTRERELAERQASAYQLFARKMKQNVSVLEREKRDREEELATMRVKAAKTKSEADKLAEEVSKLCGSLEKERLERQSKEEAIKVTSEKVDTLMGQISEVSAERADLEQKLAASEQEVIKVFSSKDEVEGKVEDAYGKLVALAEAYKDKDLRSKALEAELEEAARSSGKKLSAAIQRCALTENRETELKRENEALRRKLAKYKQMLKDQSEKSKRAAAAYRSSRM